MRSYEKNEELARVNPNEFKELSREIEKPTFDSNKINWNCIALELFRIKRLNPQLIIDYGEEKTISELDAEEKCFGYGYARDELKVLKKCMNHFNIDVLNYKVNSRYCFNNIQAHFIFYMLTRDRSKTSYISKIKTKRIDGIKATEEETFFGGFSNYLKFVNIDYEFRGIEKIFDR